MDYKTSGVDIEAGREFVSEIKQAVEGTHTSNVIEGIGGFGGLFRIPIDSFKKLIKKLKIVKQANPSSICDSILKS